MTPKLLLLSLHYLFKLIQNYLVTFLHIYNKKTVLCILLNALLLKESEHTFLGKSTTLHGEVEGKTNKYDD